ncbi:MAG TPA: PIN domain-containing protein [Verrucomicrobiota bacterium]|nr:PIN domain-containing protein [Verrucomicrobiota bacterium]
MITHVLDTSALLAHYLEEPGMDEVGRLLSGHPGEIGLCFVSWLELETRLREVTGNSAEAERAFRLYTDVLTTPLALGEAEARAAIRRLPLADSLIAGCAVAADATLVHRDPHFAAIPAKLLKQLVLPGK